MPIQASNVTHNNNGHFYRIAIDIAKEGAEVWDLTPYFKGRVGDDNFGLQIVWYYQGRLLDVTNMTPYIKGNVGHYSFDEKENLQMAPDADVVTSHGKPSDCQANGQVTYYFPQQMFPTDGVFKGFIGLEDEDQNLTGVDIWFRVLPGVAKMGHACDVYVDVLDKTIADFKEKIRQQSIDFDAALQLELQKEKDLVQQKLDAASDAMDEDTAALKKLAAAVGAIQAQIDAGNVITKTDYQKDKAATDTRVDANTRELQSHDAQLKQLTASPSSDGTTEITNARIGTAEQSARTYDTLGEAVRDQVGQATRALKNSFKELYIFSYKKEDNITYSKNDKISSTSGSIYYYNIAGVPLVRVRTLVNAYVNIFTFLDVNGKILDYQRSGNQSTTVDYVVAPPAGAITLILGAMPGANNSHDFVSVFDKGLQVGKFYQGSLNDSTHYIENGPTRASLVIDSDNYENLITASDGYQIWDDHLGDWVSQSLIPQGSGVQSVIVKKADGSNILSTEMYDHFNLKQIKKSELHLKSYRNGLTDISDTFNLSYGTILNDPKDKHAYFYSKGQPTGPRISSQFVTVDHNASWLIDLDDDYEVSFETTLKNADGEYIYHDFYNNTNVIKTAINWVGGHVYENLYTQGAYAVTFRKKDGSLIDINTLWDHVRIYEVDNAVHFPDYYRSHMQDRVDTINSKLTSPDNFGFGFITDVHAEFNTKHFPALIDEVRTKTPVNEFMGGGDWATAWFDSSNAADNKPELFHFFEELQSLFKGVPLLKTVGNHEWGYGANNDYNITSQEMYAYYLRDQDKMFKDIHWGPDHTYYYWDDQQAKCRFISLNVMDYPDTVKPTGNADNKEWYFKVSDTQINWLKSTLNSVPDGYVVAIESHLVPLNADQFASFPAAKIGATITNGEDLQAIASAYAAKTGDFASAKGDLLAWFGGHYHADDITVRNGVTYVTTIADCMSVWDIPNVPKKTAGTVSEQAFDIATVDRASRRVSLTRIGDGSDRSFTY